jgi:hypothetical protein
VNQYIAKPDPFHAKGGGAGTPLKTEKQISVSLPLFKLGFRQEFRFCVGFEFTTSAATGKYSGTHGHCNQGHSNEHQYFSHSKYLQLGINATGIG